MLLIAFGDEKLNWLLIHNTLCRPFFTAQEEEEHIPWCLWHQVWSPAHAEAEPGKTADKEDEGTKEEERTACRHGDCCHGDCCHRDGCHRGVNLAKETQSRWVTEQVPVDSHIMVMRLLLVEDASCRVLRGYFDLTCLSVFFLLYKPGKLWKVHLWRPILVRMSCKYCICSYWCSIAINILLGPYCICSLVSVCGGSG